MTSAPIPASSPAASERSLAWSDGRVLPADQASVPLLDDGFLRGDAVFEAVLVLEGRTHALEPHLRRLRRSGERIHLEVPDLRPVAADLLAAWGERDGVLRLFVTRGGAVRGLLGPLRLATEQSLAVLETPWESVLTGVKTVSYAGNMLLQRRAQELGADDALITVDGVLHELPTGAVFLVTDGELRTPDPRQLPVLDSITVQQLTAWTPARFERLTLDDVRGADEVFVVSATRPVVPVHAVVLPDGERTFPAPGPVVADLQARFRSHLRACLDDPR